MKLRVNKTDLIVKASVVEQGLIEQVTTMIERNPRLYDDETVVLMADVHKTSNDLVTDSVPVGFTMSLTKGLVPVDYVSADMFCGVTSYLIKDYVPTERNLFELSKVSRDLIPITRRSDKDKEGRTIITDLGTLGSGNHFIEIGTDGKDTLVSVHSGSRAFGGAMFKKHKKIAEEHNKQHKRDMVKSVIHKIPREEREAYIKSLPKVSGLGLLNLKEYPEYWDDLEDTKAHAYENRTILLDTIMVQLLGRTAEQYTIEKTNTVHNFVSRTVDAAGKENIYVRKGSIEAVEGDTVVIPINMRDGIIRGKVKGTEAVNFSLPHGAGRILSRGNAKTTLDLETFKEDMQGIVSTTVVEETLDESPRAYKSLDTIIKDIAPYLDEYVVYKSVFNYKGV